MQLELDKQSKLYINSIEKEINYFHTFIKIVL